MNLLTLDFRKRLSAKSPVDTSCHGNTMTSHSYRIFILSLSNQKSVADHYASSLPAELVKFLGCQTLI